MKAIVLALLMVAVAGARETAAEPASCSAQLKQQDARCQELAEKLADACPSGTNIKETAQCRDLSSQIANTCTRKPCAPPPRKGKSMGKSMGKAMAKGMGKAKETSKDKAKPKPKSEAKSK